MFTTEFKQILKGIVAGAILFIDALFFLGCGQDSPLAPQLVQDSEISRDDGRFVGIIDIDRTYYWTSALVQREVGGFVDFAFVLDDEGVFHIIGIDGSNSQWALNRNDIYPGFAHMTSRDGETWVEQEKILGSLYNTTSGYEINHIWAPCIIKVGGLWYMYYTGTTHTDDIALNEQRIFLSTSPDLINWSDPIFVLDGTSPLTAWGSGDPWTNDCRDAHVWSKADGSYGMVVSLKQADNSSMVIGVAESVDLLTWEIVSVIEGTGSDYPNRNYAESPFYLEHNGNQYVFWTPNDGTCQIQQGSNTWSRPGGKACEIIPKNDDTYFFAYLYRSQTTTGWDIKIETLFFEGKQPMMGI
jgi:hypothetical protein